MRRGIIFIRANAWLVLIFALLAVVVLSTFVREKLVAQEPLAEPPAGQTFVGTKECAACHFEQFMQWRGTPHAKAFEVLPEKYRTDGTCLKCHTTGHGEATGFVPAFASDGFTVSSPTTPASKRAFASASE